MKIINLRNNDTCLGCLIKKTTDRPPSDTSSPLRRTDFCSDLCEKSFLYNVDNLVGSNGSSDEFIIKKRCRLGPGYTEITCNLNTNSLRFTVGGTDYLLINNFEFYRIYTLEQHIRSTFRVNVQRGQVEDYLFDRLVSSDAKIAQLEGEVQELKRMVEDFMKLAQLAS